MNRTEKLKERTIGVNQWKYIHIHIRKNKSIVLTDLSLFYLNCTRWSEIKTTLVFFFFFNICSMFYYALLAIILVFLKSESRCASWNWLRSRDAVKPLYTTIASKHNLFKNHETTIKHCQHLLIIIFYD